MDATMGGGGGVRSRFFEPPRQKASGGSKNRDLTPPPPTSHTRLLRRQLQRQDLGPPVGQREPKGAIAVLLEKRGIFPLPLFDKVPDDGEVGPGRQVRHRKLA